MKIGVLVRTVVSRRTAGQGRNPVKDSRTQILVEEQPQ